MRENKHLNCSKAESFTETEKRRCIQASMVRLLFRGLGQIVVDSGFMHNLKVLEQHNIGSYRAALAEIQTRFSNVAWLTQGSPMR